MNIMKQVILKVQNAKKGDIGRTIIRIDQKAMEMLKIQTGDVIEIIGKEKSAGIAWPGYPQDNGLGIVRIDSRLQKNTGTRIDDTVEIRKVKAEPAQNIVLAPSSVKIRNNPRFESFVKRKLLNYPVTIDDYIFISIGITREIIFKVISMNPTEVCQIKMDTILKISEEVAEDYDNGKVYITFDDIGGLKSEIDEVRSIFDLALIKKLNIDVPRGILLVGPPGVGKTLLVQAIANNSEYHFISIVATEIIQKYRGESEEKLRDIFQEANEKAPSIIFFDHIDAIAVKIQKEVNENYNYTIHRVVTQLMGLMDGLLPNKDVIVLATTHRLDLIEPALLRPGRFDKIIHIPLPDFNGRIKIFEIHTQKLHIDDDVLIKELAELSNDFTGADIKGVCQFAMINAAKRNIPDTGAEIEEISDEEVGKIKINKQDFLSAIKEVTERLDLVPHGDD